MEYKWKVKKSERGVTLENFIYKKLGDWSHAQVKAAIDKKRAFVNGKNVFISKWNLKDNSVVMFVPTEKDLPKVNASSGRYKFVDVLYEDNHILAVNKPAHVDFESYVKTVQEYITRKNKMIGYPYLGQMHRLDKETSGVMLFTKKKVANTLAAQFREHTISKFYLAIVNGQVAKEQGKISKAIEKGEFGEGQKVRISDDAGKTATTLYRVIERYDKATLLHVEILTGRTHQIRIHMKHLGHPIVGDKLYGTDKGLEFRRHALHAERIDFKHPVTKAKMKIMAAVPEDMMKLIGKLRGIS